MSAHPEHAQTFDPKPISKQDLSDRLPPHSKENEEALLCSLVSGCDVRAALLEGLRPEHFYFTRNGWLYEAICELFDRDNTTDIDTIMVEERMRERGQFDEAGGFEYLTYLTMVPNIGYTVRSYAKTIRQKALRRAMLNKASELATMAYDESTDPGVQLDRHEHGIKAIKPFDPNREFVLGEDSHHIHTTMLQEQSQRQVWHAVPWLAMADRAPVVMDGDLVVIVGPEGAGKSAMLMNWAEFEARNGNKTVYVPTEMNRKTVFDRRVVSNRKLIPFKRLQKPEELTDHDWLELELSGDELGSTTLPNLHYWFVGTVDETRLFGGMQRLVDDYGMRTFVIDYLNDVAPDKERGQNEASAWRKLLARFEEFNRQNSAVVITAAQLNQQGQAYQIGRALRQKSMLFLKLKPTELDHIIEFEYEDIPYQYLPGDYNPKMRIAVEKYRGGGRGVFELLFVGPRYLWVDVPLEFDDGCDDPGAYDTMTGGRGAKD
jgi:replicative DNA helicase